MKMRSVRRNAVLNITITCSNMLFPLLVFPYVSRVLQVDNMGRVSFFTSVAGYAVLVASLGLSTYGIRAVARVRDDREALIKTVQELLYMNLIVTAAVITLMLGSALFVDKFKEELTLLFANAVLVLSAPFGMSWLFAGLEQYEYIAKRTLFFKALSLIMIFMLVREPADYTVYAWITICSSAGSNICNFIYAGRFVTYIPRKNLQFKKHLKPMILLFASALAVNIYTNLDTVMLGFISGDVQVGLYTVAVHVKTVLLALVNAVSAVLLPRLSYYYSEKKEDALNHLLRKSISVIFMLSVPITLFFILTAKEWILLFGGQSYLGAVPCMQLIMPVLLISGFSNVTGNQILIPAGKDSCFMKAVASGAVLDLCLNALLMRPLGGVGAALATLLAELLQMMIQLYYAHTYILANIRWKTLINITVSALAASLLLLIVRCMADFHVWLEMAVFSMVFFGTYGGCILGLREPAALEMLGCLAGKRKSPGQIKHMFAEKE